MEGGGPKKKVAAAAAGAAAATAAAAAAAAAAPTAATAGDDEADEGDGGDGGDEGGGGRKNKEFCLLFAEWLPEERRGGVNQRQRKENINCASTKKAKKQKNPPRFPHSVLLSSSGFE